MADHCWLVLGAVMGAIGASELVVRDGSEMIELVVRDGSEMIGAVGAAELVARGCGGGGGGGGGGAVGDGRGDGGSGGGDGAGSGGVGFGLLEALTAQQAHGHLLYRGCRLVRHRTPSNRPPSD